MLFKKIKSFFSHKKNPLNLTKKKLIKLSNLKAKTKSFIDQISSFELNPQKIKLKAITEHTKAIHWGLLLFILFLLANICSSLIGLFIHPVSPKIPMKKPISDGRSQSQLLTPQFDTEEIERRNIFDVYNTKPAPFEASVLDCMSQARRTSRPIELLGTIVMSDERYSTALVQEQGSLSKIAVKKDEWFFDGKYLVMSIERKKLCFQVRDSQDMEYIDIPEQEGESFGPRLGTAHGTTSIKPLSEKDYEIDKKFLDEKLLNLTEILQTARAIPHIDHATGQFQGFLVQSIDPDSPFMDLGVRPGDILIGINDIKLDNIGKPLEAFQQLRYSNKIHLHILRGGTQITINYSIK